MSEERAESSGGDPRDERDDIDELLDDPDETEPEGDEPELETEPEPEAAQQRQPSRYQRRISRQQEEIKDLREQNRRIIEALARPQQPAAPTQPDPARQAELDRQEIERVSQMPFEEQSRYWARKSEERIERRLQLQSLQQGDTLDRYHFQQLMRAEKYPARYATEVENRLSQARQAGMNPSREQVLNELIGSEVRAKRERETERQRRSGQRRIASQTTTPSRTGSTAGTGGGVRRGQNQEAADEALLRGITVGDFVNVTGA